MSITVWHSGEDFARWFVANTILSKKRIAYEHLAASDASQPQRFHKMPDHLKQILYLDSPDVIVECDGEPIISIEVTTEAGTGHNAFQRFSRIIAAVENGVPALYIYPEAKVVRRSGSLARWDALNPNIFAALEQLMDIHQIPALLFYFPSQFRTKAAANIGDDGLLCDASHPSSPRANDSEMRCLFSTANAIMWRYFSNHPRARLMRDSAVVMRRTWMRAEWANKGGAVGTFSPQTATVVVPSSALCAYLQKFTPSRAAFARTNMLLQRQKTAVYQVGGAFRADPYTGAAAALDYLMCREGTTFEDRHMNLAVAFGTVEYTKRSDQVTVAPNPKGSVVSADDFVTKVSQVRSQPNACLLAAPTFANVGNIPRYYMQARYGCSFTKAKEIRIFAFFADALLFHDGAFWREG